MSYECENGYVFRQFLKVTRIDADRRYDGRLFHAVGPATGNVRLPSCCLVRDTTRSARLQSVQQHI